MNDLNKLLHLVELPSERIDFAYQQFVARGRGIANLRFIQLRWRLTQSTQLLYSYGYYL